MPKPKFDPNKPFKVAGNADAGAKPAFDPSKPFEEVGAEKESSLLDTELPFGTSPRGFIQGGLNALPVIGAGAGGLVGAVGGPAGSVAGSSAGSAAGQNLKTIGEQVLLGQKAPSREEYYKGLATAGLEGASQEMGGQALSAGASAVAKSKVGQYVGKKLGKVASKIGSTISGVPEKEIETYAKHADEINAMAKAADNDAQAMADGLRGKLNEQVQGTRKTLNEQISTALKARESESIDIKPVIDELEKAKTGINKKLYKDQIEEIDDIIKTVSELGEGKNSANPQNVHDLKEYLQGLAEGAYQKGGQIFQVGDKAQRAAKSGAAIARKVLNAAAPEVASANNQLHKLRVIESKMNRNILAEGKTAAALYSAGSGGNPANQAMLKKLGDTTGTDMIGEAEKLAAARTFGKPALLPADTTGKSLTRMGAAGVGGFLAGGIPGAIAGEVLASPAGMKAAINTGRAAGGLGGGLLNSPASAGLLLTPLQRELLKKKRLEQQIQYSPEVLQSGDE